MSLKEEIHMTENGMELVLDSVESEKEITSILENAAKLEKVNNSKHLSSNSSVDSDKQCTTWRTKTFERTWIINDDHMLAVEGLRVGEKKVLGLMLLKKFGPNKHKIKPQLGNDGYTYICFKLKEDMKIAKKLLNTKGILKHKITAEEVIGEKQIQYFEFDVQEYKEHVEIRNEQIRNFAVQMEMRLLQNIPTYESLVNERKAKYDDIFCEVDELRHYTPKKEPYLSCCFLIVEDMQTGLPTLLLRDSSGKVKRNWRKRNYYHSDVLAAAGIFEKLIVSSQWKVAKGESGLWRKLIIRSNKKGDLLFWVEVQSTEYSALDEAKHLQMQCIEFFERGIGRKCKVTSVYAQVMFIDAASKSQMSLIKLLMGSAFFGESICGLHIKVSPKFSVLRSIGRPEILCSIVQNVVKPVDNVSFIVVGCADSGIVGLRLAKTVGEVIFIDRIKAIRILKHNVQQNELSGCTFFVGAPENVLPDITLKHSTAYAFVTLTSFATAAACRAMTALRDIPVIKKLVLLLESSKPFTLIMKTLADPTLSGTPFFPQKIIPFDTLLNEKHFMMVIVMDRLQNQGSPFSKLEKIRDKGFVDVGDRHDEFRDMREKINQKRMEAFHSKHDAEHYSKELSDARKEIQALQSKKGKTELDLRNAEFHKRPNLVIRVETMYNEDGNKVGSSCFQERNQYGVTECKQRDVEDSYRGAEENTEKELDERGRKNKISRAISIAGNTLIDSVKESIISGLDDEVAFYLKKAVADSSTGVGTLGNKTWPVNKNHYAPEQVNEVEYECHSMLPRSRSPTMSVTKGGHRRLASLEYELQRENKLKLKNDVTVTLVQQRIQNKTMDTVDSAHGSNPDYKHQARYYINEEQDIAVKRNSYRSFSKNDRVRERISPEEDFKVSQDLCHDSEIASKISAVHPSIRKQAIQPAGRTAGDGNFQNMYTVSTRTDMTSCLSRRYNSRESAESQSGKKQISKIYASDTDNNLDAYYHSGVSKYQLFKQDKNGKYDKTVKSVRQPFAGCEREFEEKGYIQNTSPYKRYADVEYERGCTSYSGNGQKAKNVFTSNQYVNCELSINKRNENILDDGREIMRPKQGKFHLSDEHMHVTDRSSYVSNPHGERVDFQMHRSNMKSEPHYYQQEKSNEYYPRESYSKKRKLHDESTYENMERQPYKKRNVDFYEPDIHVYKKETYIERNMPSDRKKIENMRYYDVAPTQYMSSDYTRPLRKEKSPVYSHVNDMRNESLNLKSYPEAYQRESRNIDIDFQKKRPLNVMYGSHPENMKEVTSKQMQHDAAGHYSERSDFGSSSKPYYERDSRGTKGDLGGYVYHNKHQQQRSDNFTHYFKQEHPSYVRSRIASPQPYRPVPNNHRPTGSSQIIIPKISKNRERQH